MSRAGPPDAGAQACPRSLCLLPDRFFVPPATLAVLLRRGAIPLLYSGWGLEPSVRDGAVLEARGGLAPRRGDLVVANLAGHADLLRLLRREGANDWWAALDGYPRRPIVIGGESILGRVTSIDGRPPGRLGALLAARGGLGAAWLGARRILSAPRWQPGASGSVLDKYVRQVGAYVAAAQSNLTDEHLRLVASAAGGRGRLLVAGCGAGAEALHLARAGHQVIGFDALPEMVAAASEAARVAGADVRFVVADARHRDWPAGPYDAAYMTPLLYSFVQGRDDRVAFLRGLGRSLHPGGFVLYSARLCDGPLSFLQTRLAWCRPAPGGDPPGGEPGDWYTRYLAPDGTIGVSFLRRLLAGEVLAEARAAGFGTVERRGSDFIAADFRGP